MSRSGPSLPRPFGSRLHIDDSHVPLQWEEFNLAISGLIPIGRIYSYCIHLYNYNGPAPRPHGPPTWGDNPYGYTDADKDANRSLGWSDWTKHPQVVTIPQKIVPHWAFIPLHPRGLTITNTRLWPFHRSYPPEYARNEVYQLDGQYFRDVQGDSVRAAVNCYYLAFHCLNLRPASPFNYDWAVGEQWNSLMTKADDVMLWWQTQEWLEEACRRLVDALGWMEFSLRQIVEHVTAVAGLNPPRWVMEGRFVGIIIDGYYQDTVSIGMQLAKMGAPVWEISIAERNPPLTILPPGARESHPAWIRYLQDAKKSKPDLDPESSSSLRGFGVWWEEMIRRGHAMQPIAALSSSVYSPSSVRTLGWTQR
jgi:hypothetical protein